MWGNKVYSKEDACYESMLNAYIESDGLQVKICAACGKKFIPYGRNKSRTKYCPLAHYVECGICGKETFIKRSRLKEVKKTGIFQLVALKNVQINSSMSLLSPQSKSVMASQTQATFQEVEKKLRLP